MADIMQDLAEVLAGIEDSELLPSRIKIYMLLTRAAGAIDRLQRENLALQKDKKEMLWQDAGGDF
jgi:hypothetical protein